MVLGVDVCWMLDVGCWMLDVVCIMGGNSVSVCSPRAGAWFWCFFFY